MVRVPLLVLGCALGAVALAQRAAPDLALFFRAAASDGREADTALAQLAPAWRNGYTAMIVDLARLIVGRPGTGAPSPVVDLRDPSLVPEGARARPAPPPARARLIRFLERQTGQRFGDDLGRWRQWMWKLPYEPHPEYLRFKGLVYSRIDPLMATFFTGTALIRLDEIDWGGVKVNGIPPLRYPRVVAASDAGWLQDSHVVFGLAIGGEARAYPKRILAWHEMATDRLGGVEITVVYCTLCGTVIPYESTVGGVLRTFGTSGLLYRSNKLMFDEQSRSLWSTLEGGPVVGPLASSELRLEALPVVTSTWGEWRTRHPATTVVSLETGFDRDYSEGAAYRDYFATDRLMFGVPFRDTRLDNKDEIVGLLLPAAGGGRQAVALSVAYLRRNPLYHATFEGRPIVVLSSADGGNRVYDAAAERFARLSSDGRLVDLAGRRWAVTEVALVLEGTPAVRLPRRTAFRAFWFGWFAQFPDTVLVK
jgi:hypothetical protein